MAALMTSLKKPSESELSAVFPNLLITLSGHHLHESKIAPQENLKNTLSQSFMDKILRAQTADEQNFIP